MAETSEIDRRVYEIHREMGSQSTMIGLIEKQLMEQAKFAASQVERAEKFEHIVIKKIERIDKRVERIEIKFALISFAVMYVVNNFGGIVTFMKTVMAVGVAYASGG